MTARRANFLFTRQFFFFFLRDECIIRDIFYRIITNGSLPRDKRFGYNSPFDSPKSPSKNQPHFSFDSSKQTSTVSYENICTTNSKIILQNNDRIVQNENHPYDVTQELPHAITPNNNQPKHSYIHNTNGNYNSSEPISQTDGRYYENIVINNNKNSETHTDTNFVKTDDNTKGLSSTCETIQLDGIKVTPQQQMRQNGNVSLYENVILTQTLRNNNQNHTMPKKNSQLLNSYEMIENKLAISNDDLLEAIEQLSMLSKSKEICMTPKRNNSEKDNTKSNEAKADKKRKQLEEEDRKKYIEFLQNEKLHILGNMDILKRSVAEIEIQEEEINREVICLFIFLILKLNKRLHCCCFIYSIYRILNKLCICSLYYLLHMEC